MKRKIIISLLACLVLAAVVWAGTISEQPYGIAFPKWYSYSDGAKSTYYLEQPTLLANDQVVTEDTTQTLTNKTLTSPTITTPTINGAILGTADYAFATTTADDTYDVSGVSAVFLDSTSFAGTIGGLTGGVSGQILVMSVIDATETITIENAEGGTGQDINLDGAADITLNVNEGVVLLCDGSDWWEIRR